MNDNNENKVNSAPEQEPIEVEVVPEVTTTTEPEADLSAKNEEVVTTKTTTSTVKKNIKIYTSTVLVILIIGMGLMFALEKEGRISTGIFGSLTSNNKTVVTVNGEAIKQSDYDTSMRQLLDMAAEQGASTTDEAVLTDLKKQAIDSLVNGELLRQLAIADGITATSGEIEAQYKGIEDGVGGTEALQARLKELAISEKTVRRDIENQIIIQQFINKKFPFNESEVTDEEINKFYTDAGGEKAGLPPLKNIRDQVIAQIRQNRQQEAIFKYLEEERKNAEINVLI